MSDSWQCRPTQAPTAHRHNALDHRHTRDLMDMLHLKQILSILALFLHCACAAPPCFPEKELQNKADQKFRSHYPQPHEPPVTHNPGHCPVEWFSQSPRDANTNNRSLSPWIYESKQMADHFPSTYVQAKCLCDGCIQFNKDGPFQNHIFNSVAVYQSRIFLKREPCNYNSTYRLTPIAENVAVACTCVNPKRVS